ncbi:MAG TPA: hypothetical protein VGM51_11875 [Armatimonadota bacterium]|jgi:hypothetical protein
MDSQHINDAVREFLGDSAPASELRLWREALEQRLNRLRAEAAQDPQTHEALRLKIAHLEKQVHALMEEEAISGFVEETVRASVADVGGGRIDRGSKESEVPPWADFDVDDIPDNS